MKTKKIDKFLNSLKLQIISEPKLAVKPKKLRKAFTYAVDSLREGKLKTNIQNNLEDYFSELQNNLTIEATSTRRKEKDSCTETEQRKRTDTADDRLRQRDTKDLPEGGHLPYNWYCDQACTITEEHLQQLDQEERCKTYQVYLRCNLLNLENDTLLEIAEKCQPKKPDAGKLWIERLLALCSCLLGDDDPNKLQKVMEIFNGQFALVAEELCDSNKNKQRRLKQLCHTGEQMLKFFHLHYHAMNCVFEARPCYEDFLAGILATYIDAHLSMIHCDSEHSELSSRHMHGLVLRLLGNKVHYGYDILLQLDHVRETDSAFLLPLARCFLQRMEDTTSPKLYTKFVLAARMILNMWPDLSKDLQQGVLNVAAPRTYLAWVRDRNASLMDNIPENKHFRGVNITRWFLEEVDEETVQSLLDLLMVEEEKSFYEVPPSPKASPDRLELQQAEMDTFVIDKAPNIDTANLLKDMMKDAEPTLGADSDNVEWVYVDLDELEDDRESEVVDVETPDTPGVVYELYTKNESRNLDIIQRTEKVLQSINTTAVSTQPEGSASNSEESCQLIQDEMPSKVHDKEQQMIFARENTVRDKMTSPSPTDARPSPKSGKQRHQTAANSTVRDKMTSPSPTDARPCPKSGKQPHQTATNFTECDKEEQLSQSPKEAVEEMDVSSELYSGDANTSDEDSEAFHQDMMETLMGDQLKEPDSDGGHDCSGVSFRPENGRSSSPAKYAQFGSPPRMLNYNSSSPKFASIPVDIVSVQNVNVVSTSSSAVTVESKQLYGEDEASPESQETGLKATQVSPIRSLKYDCDNSDRTTIPKLQCTSPSVSVHEKAPVAEMNPTSADQLPVALADSVKKSQKSISSTVTLQTGRQSSPKKSPNIHKNISPTKLNQDLPSTHDRETRASPKSSPSKPASPKTSPSRKAKYVESPQSKRRKVPMDRDIDHTPSQDGSQRRSSRKSLSKTLDRAMDVFKFTSDSEVDDSVLQQEKSSPDVRKRRKSALPQVSIPTKPLDLQMTRILQEEGLKPRRRMTASSAEIAADLSKLTADDGEEKNATAVFPKPSYGSKTYSSRRRSMPVNVASQEEDGSEAITGGHLAQGLSYTSLLTSPRRSRRISEMSIDSTDSKTAAQTSSGRKVSTPERYKASPDTKKRTPRRSMSTPTKK